MKDISSLMGMKVTRLEVLGIKMLEWREQSTQDYMLISGFCDAFTALIFREVVIDLCQKSEEDLVLTLVLHTVSRSDITARKDVERC